MKTEDVRLVFSVIEYTLIVSLDHDLKARTDQLLGSRGGERGTTFKLLGFTAQPKAWCGHCGERGEARCEMSTSRVTVKFTQADSMLRI